MTEKGGAGQAHAYAAAPAGLPSSVQSERASTPDPHPPVLPACPQPRAAGKLALLQAVLPRLLAGGHRVLIFSQYVEMLDILEVGRR